MAKDVADVLGTAIGHAAREAAKNLQASATKRSRGNIVDRVSDAVSDRMDGSFSGAKGVAAGAGLATLVPLVAKGAGKLVRGIGDGGGPVQKVGDKVGGKVKDAVGDQVEKAGGAGGIAKEAGKSMLPGVGGDKSDKKKKGVPGVGKGRRMPFQWDIDIGVPLPAVWEQWTNYEQWPEFMHRLQNVSQEDDKTIKFKAKVWGISREFTAEIVELKEKQRIKWEVTEGLTHQGVVTFHELGPRLTRVEVSFDVEPGGMIEKMARGMRHVKRAARADLARFKAHVLMEEGDAEESHEDEQAEQSSSRSSSAGGSRSATKRSSNGRSRSERKQSSSRGRSSSSGSGRKQSSSSSGRKSTASSGRKQSGSSSGGTRASSSSGRKQSSSSGGRTRASSSGGQKRSASKRSSSGSSNGSSSSSRTRASSGSSSNGRSSSSRTQGSSSNGRSRSSAKKRTSSRS